MIVSRARVRYFRSIIDTGWVDLETDITTLLGKNESGKSSFLQALASVSNEDPIDERDQNYNTNPGEEPFEMVRLELVPEDGSDVLEFEKIELATPLYIVKFSDGTRRLEAGSNKITVSSEKTKEEIIDAVSAFDQAVELPDDASGNLNNDYNSNIQRYVDNILNKGKTNDLQWVLNQLDQLINGLDTLPSGLQFEGSFNSLSDVRVIFQDLHQEGKSISELKISSLLPSIVYHSEFDRIKDSVKISSITEPENRTFRNVLELAGIDYQEFNQKDEFKQSRELRRAEAEISGDVNNIWDQKSVNVGIDISGQKFIIQIADDSLNTGESKTEIQREFIRPSSRSEGFRWFFSFYTNLTAETSDGEENKLLLLDDPAVSLHPEGKKNWLDSIEQMADDAQFVYSSHSPFLIKKEHPERIRLVEDKPKKGTKITSQWAEGDSMALKPLRSALGIGLGDSPFASKRQLLVEGVTDYYIITAVNNYLKSIDMDFIDSGEVSIMPTNGAPNMPDAAKWVASEDFAYAILLDNDREGKDAKDTIIEQHPEVDPDKIIMLELDDGRNQFHIEIEDLFSTQFYIESVNKAYSKEFPDEFSEISIQWLDDGYCELEGVTYNNRKITSKLDEVLDNQGMGDFDKVLVSNVIRDRLNRGNVDKSDIENFLPMFDEIRRNT